MHFLPRPGGSGEDDGVLVTIVFDGPKEQVLDDSDHDVDDNHDDPDHDIHDNHDDPRHHCL